MSFASKEELGFQDPQLCKTISTLLDYKCKGIEATSKSLLQAYRGQSVESLAKKQEAALIPHKSLAIHSLDIQPSPVASLSCTDGDVSGARFGWSK